MEEDCEGSKNTPEPVRRRRREKMGTDPPREMDPRLGNQAVKFCNTEYYTKYIYNIIDN